MRNISDDHANALNEIFDNYGVVVDLWLAYDGYTEAHIGGASRVASRTTDDAINQAKAYVKGMVAATAAEFPDGDACDRFVGF